VIAVCSYRSVDARHRRPAVPRVAVRCDRDTVLACGISSRYHRRCARTYLARRLPCTRRPDGRLGRRQFEPIQRRLLAFVDRVTRSRAAGWPGADRSDRAQYRIVQMVPSTFFPEQDNGISTATITSPIKAFLPGDGKKLEQFDSTSVEPIRRCLLDRFTARRPFNSQRVCRAQPLAQRHVSADQVVQRLRLKLNRVSGARCFCRRFRICHRWPRQSAANTNTR